jgi:glycosyltransferase involved in cell wall biosynthesis
VDVIVPCYNYARYLRTCVDSLLSQEGVGVRVLILDDHSTDSSPDIGIALARQDDRVTFRRHVRNHGHIATYNEGLAWVQAPYLLLISADDLLVPGALARATSVLEAHPAVTMVHGRQIAFRGEPTLPADAATPGVTVTDGAEFIDALCTAADNPVATPTVVCRTAVQRLVGGYEPTLPHTADLEIWLRFASFGHVARLDACQAFKRGHERNMQHAYVHRAAGDLLERRAAFEMFLDRPECHVINREGLKARVTQALAMAAFWRGTELFELGMTAEADKLWGLAAEMDPALPGRREWKRMQMKRRIGPGLWRRVNRGLAAVRTKTPVPAPTSRARP